MHYVYYDANNMDRLIKALQGKHYLVSGNILIFLKTTILKGTVNIFFKY